MAMAAFSKRLPPELHRKAKMQPDKINFYIGPFAPSSL